MTRPPRIGVGVFVDYANSSGSTRMTIIKQQMERITDPTRLAWYPYTVIRSALRSSLASTDPIAPLRRALDRATPAMRSHYEEIAAGWERWLDRNRGTTLVPVTGTSWNRHGLTITVGRHLGLRSRDGRTTAALLYLKRQPLTPGGANVGLRILDQSMDRILPGAEAAVIDVRRAKVHRIRANQKLDSLDSWIESEAVGYLTHWNARSA
jgi:hypothetical protein